MSAVAEREEAMRMLLAEVEPVPFNVEAKAGVPGGIVRTPRVTPTFLKAVRLSALKLYGPDALTSCDGHSTGTWLACPGVPVSWALLGHTCGRSDGAA